MSTFTLAISCLTTFNLPWFMDLTFQVPMQYCSLQHQTLLPSPVTSTAGCCFCFDSISSFFLELFLNIIYSYLVLHFILNIMFGCAGSSSLYRLFSSCSEPGLLSLRVCPSHCGVFSCCGVWAPGWAGSGVVAPGLYCTGSGVVEHGLYGSGMWDLPGARIEPMTPALAGGFVTAGPPGKSMERLSLSLHSYWGEGKWHEYPSNVDKYNEGKGLPWWLRW